MNNSFFSPLLNLYDRFKNISISSIYIPDSVKHKFINFIDLDSSIKERYMVAIKFLKGSLFDLNKCIFLDNYIIDLINEFNKKYNKNYNLNNLSVFLDNGVYPCSIDSVEFYRYLIYTSVGSILVFYVLYLYERYNNLNIEKIVNERIDLYSILGCCRLSNKDFVESLYEMNIIRSLGNE